MDINNKKIYLPLIAISLAIIAIWILFHIELIKLISQLSTFGILIIACLAWREYQAKAANQVNDKQLEKVVELVEYLRKKRKFYINTPYDGEDYVDLIGLLETTDDIQSLKISFKELEKIEKKLWYYSNHPLIPYEISQTIKIFLNQVQLNNLEGKYIAVENIISIAKLEDHQKQQLEPTQQYLILKQYVSEIVLALQQWLHQNDVQSVNLPSLDPALCGKKELPKLQASQSNV